MFLVFSGSLMLPWTADSLYGAIPFQKSEITIFTQSGKHRFSVELAETPEQRAQGLQNRKTLPTGSGMLFDFKRNKPVIMWMKNTYLSLDMIFISRDGTIVSMATGTVPFSLTLIPSRHPVTAVLEVSAGTVRVLGIRVGDRVEHALFKASE